MATRESIFEVGTNCWNTAEATFAAPLIDCANYYRALHSSICKAQKSIFIIGWDIDSRIRLLHGEEEKNSDAPSVISELLAWKAEQNPDLAIYLVRWDSSLAFLGQREMWAEEVWEEKTPDNVQIMMDDTIPMGGSQHQKVVVIDDEVVFSGGMDVSVHRWDTRDHPVNSEDRVGPDGKYEPLHDVQVVSAGPIVAPFAKLARWRWNRIAKEPVAEFDEKAFSPAQDNLPATWPDECEPWFKNVDCALARTIPFMDENEPVQEVRTMLLDLIGQAESFIYIENQFTTRIEIAEAINDRLKASPDLHVVMVSSYEPQGVFECEAYWASRIAFKKRVQEGVDPDRVVLTYSSIHDQKGNLAYKRIHSKVMTIDDKYLVIGSSNLSNRSMTLDTEVDLVFYGNNDENQKCITRMRDDLLAEHTGRDIETTHELLSQEQPITALLENQLAHGYVLTEVNDENFTEASQSNVFRSISDPEEPLIPPMKGMGGKLTAITNPKRRTFMVAIGLVILAIIIGLMVWASVSISWLDSDRIGAFLEESRGTYFALPTVLLVYLVGGFLFFPVTVMSLAVAAIFGPIWGPIYGMLGALLSSASTFAIGKLLGTTGIKKLVGPKVESLDKKLKHSGIVGVATIRMLPIAPFSLVNLVAGISSIGIVQFLVGTFLGMAPQMIAKGLVGDSIMQIFRSPSPETIGYLVGGIVVWIAMIYGSQKFAQYYQAKKQQAAAEADECIA